MATTQLDPPPYDGSITNEKFYTTGVDYPRSATGRIG